MRLSMGTALVALLLTSGRAVVAQTVSVSGSPASFRVSTAVAGLEPAALTDVATTYTVNTPAPGNNKYQVTAQLNANMPVGTTLSATLAAPTGAGATSSGAIPLTVTPQTLVYNIKKNFSGTAGITYQFAATVSAGVISSTTRTVTLTITTYP
jgi:hypothetical protein